MQFRDNLFPVFHLPKIAGIEIMIAERRLHIPGEVPEDFANAVVTVSSFRDCRRKTRGTGYTVTLRMNPWRGSAIF